MSGDCIASDGTVSGDCIASDVNSHCTVASNTAPSRLSPKIIVPSIHIHAPRSGAFVIALIVGVFHGAFDEESSLVAGLPDLQTILVLEQVAAFAVKPPGGWFPTVLAQDLHPCSAYVTHRVVTASENLLAGGTDISAALLLDRFSSSAWCIDQDACCGRLGG